MADHHPRSSYESDRLPYTKVTERSAVRAAIGEALKDATKFRNPCHRKCLRLDAGERTA